MIENLVEMIGLLLICCSSLILYLMQKFHLMAVGKHNAVNTVIIDLRRSLVNILFGFWLYSATNIVEFVQKSSVEDTIA